MLIFICAGLIAILQAVFLFVPEMLPLHILTSISFVLSVFLLGAVFMRGRRELMQTEAKIMRLKDDNSRLSSQLNQVLVERKQCEAKIKDLETALTHEKSKSQHYSSERKSQSDAITLLGLLQSKGRFVDFIMGDIAAYSDDKVASAARFVHQGCKEVLSEHSSISPIESIKEGEEICFEKRPDPLKVKLLGKLDRSPLKGVLLHRGWKASYLRLPQPVLEGNGDELVISPAEVEIK
ncbi:MAG: DUF2760 domain-containing protein [SAR324 cluster bacterium]|uniref:DUF2760 domain-containing protein n=1 Tax=SAR324 cluster bacterium TaxID=2024889 RepID=A0A7X9FSU1_9DELT|nr:DUF2760 domain-containing protein [SAR324 cluster bacterium]